MKVSKSFFIALLLAGSLGLSIPPVGAQGFLYKVRAGETNYCHMKFPAIREGTLYSSHAVLADPGTSDIIDFYGSCDHDPLGKDEVQAQKRQLRHELHADAD